MRGALMADPCGAEWIYFCRKARPCRGLAGVQYISFKSEVIFLRQTVQSESEKVWTEAKRDVLEYLGAKPVSEPTFSKLLRFRSFFFLPLIFYRERYLACAGSQAHTPPSL